MIKEIYNKVSTSRIFGSKPFQTLKWLFIRQPFRMENDFYMKIDKDTSMTYYVNRTYEPQSTKEFYEALKEGMTGLDIGANIGYYSLLMARKCKKVYAFEPTSIHYSTLLENIEVNKFSDKI